MNGSLHAVAFFAEFFSEKIVHKLEKLCDRDFFTRLSSRLSIFCFYLCTLFRTHSLGFQLFLKTVKIDFQEQMCIW